MTEGNIQTKKLRRLKVWASRFLLKLRALYYFSDYPTGQHFTIKLEFFTHICSHSQRKELSRYCLAYFNILISSEYFDCSHISVLRRIDRHLWLE